MSGESCACVDFNTGTGKAHVVFGNWKAAFHAVEKACDDGFNGATKDGGVRAAHSGVGQIRSASGEHATIGGGYVGVRSNDGGGASV